jgi:hypothetical protein
MVGDACTTCTETNSHKGDGAQADSPHDSLLGRRIAFRFHGRCIGSVSGGINLGALSGKPVG